MLATKRDQINWCPGDNAKKMTTKLLLKINERVQNEDKKASFVHFNE